MNKKAWGVINKSVSLFLALCLIVTSCYTTSWAAETEEPEVREYIVDVDWERLQGAILDAIRQEKKAADYNQAEFFSDDESLVAEYEQLLAGSGKNPLYQVDYSFGKDDLPSGTAIRIFVRKEEKEVDYDLANRSAGRGAESTETETAAIEIAETESADIENAETGSADAEPAEVQETAENVELADGSDEAAVEVTEAAESAEVTEPVVLETDLETAEDVEPESTEAASEAAETELVADTTEDDSPSDEAAGSGEYELTGNEAVYILYSNKSKHDVVFQLRINGFLTPKAYVYSPKELKNEMGEEVPVSETVTETTAEALESGQDQGGQPADTVPESGEVSAEPSHSDEALTTEPSADPDAQPEAGTDSDETGKESGAADSSESKAADTDKAEADAAGTEAPVTGGAEVSQGTADTEKKTEANDAAAKPAEAKTPEAKEQPAASENKSENDGAQTLSLSRHEAPVVGSAYEEEIGVNHDPVLTGSSRNTAVMMTMFSVSAVGLAKKTSKLTVTNTFVAGSDAADGLKVDYTAVITGSDGTETADRDMTADFDGSVNTLKFSLGADESIVISHIDSNAAYAVTQEDKDHVSCTKMDVEYKRFSGGEQGSGSGEEDSSSGAPDYGYDLSDGAYASLIDRAEALSEAAGKCADDPENANKVTPALLKLLRENLTYIKNESYRNRLIADAGYTDDQGRPRWPLVTEAGLTELVKKSSAYLSHPETATGNMISRDEFLSRLYLNIYVRPTDSHPEIIPYISESSHARDQENANKWNAYILFDYGTNTWYQYDSAQKKYYSSIANLFSYSADKYISLDSSWTVLNNQIGSGSSSTESGASDGTFTQNGFSFNVNVTYQNRYTAPVKAQYQVTFEAAGQEISVQQVTEGEAAAAPAMEDIPAVEGKQFKNWDKDFTNIQNDTTVTAIYEDVAPQPPVDNPEEEEDPADPPKEEEGSTDNGNTNGGSTGGSSSGSSSRTPGGSGGYAQGGPGDTGSADGLVTIDPEAVPLANLPTSMSDNVNQALTVIDDGEVPLASLPKTGDNGSQGLAVAMSGVLLALYMAISKKKEKES